MSHAIRAFCISVPVGIAIVDIFGHIAKVDGQSMQPSLNPKESSSSDYVFLNRWCGKNFDYSRGDVVSLVSPKNPNYLLIKRIIAFEGDTVRTLGYRENSIRIPKGHCWVEGDHTGHSLDSNVFGPVALGLIQAKATKIVWPPNRWQNLESCIPKGREILNRSLKSFSEI